MIVRRLLHGVQLITQPDHAHLSQRIMEHCAELDDRPRRQSILLAIGQHDNGWEEEDAAPVVDLETGTVVDFVTAALAVRHRVWPRAIGRLSHDPWAAALVGQHALTVYDRFQGDAAWTSFFDELTVLRDAMLGASGGSFAGLLDDYSFVRLGDLISLTFCTGWTDEQRFGGWVVRGSGASVTVTPKSFPRPVPFDVAARELRAAAFRSDAELREALAATAATMLHGEVV